MSINAKAARSNVGASPLIPASRLGPRHRASLTDPEQFPECSAKPEQNLALLSG
jgi:hypothetical protein